jgi:ABC-type lipoprotein export system ATPase subunit
MALIELQDVSKLYGYGDATTVALDAVSLSVERGEFVAVMGQSGSGKSTLLHIIALLDNPSSGAYLLEGKDVARIRTSQRARARRDKIGFIFQSFNLLPNLSVIENVALPLTYKGMTSVRRQKRASAALEKVGIKEKEYYLPKQLSGGQVQRAAIARALVNNPSIIIADEPTGNLDTQNSNRVMELLAELHRAGNTIIMVTHNPELTRYASRVIYMSDGAITTDESTAVGLVPISAQKLLLPTYTFGAIDSVSSQKVAPRKSKKKNEKSQS